VNNLHNYHNNINYTTN